MTTFETGTVLGDRFEVVGVLGRGGTATVVLATDRMRNERVALKVIHEHLSSDASTRRRLHREVQAAGLIRHEAALVPHDLHELDGRIALSMPYHPGQTLEERVSEVGPLPLAEVRQIGLRLAKALATAHRAGVLHRDVTASNVLLTEGGTDTALTDFGLARLRHGGTRSTTMLGTAGYAAPEVYAGQRSDPRSDLYGLGATLYLAATGQPAFDARDPIAALRKQIDGVQPVRELRPDVPAALAATIEALLAPDPSGRPAGAREVVDQLEQGVPPPPAVAASDDDGIRRQYLPPGEWTIVIRERDEDQGRRRRRRTERGRAPTTPDVQIAKTVDFAFRKFRDLVGMPHEDTITPEDALANVVAEEAGLAHGSLSLPAVVFDRKFRLIDRTDETTAHRLAEHARATGFRARAVTMGDPTPMDLLAAYFWVPFAVGWTAFPFLVAIAEALLGSADLAAGFLIPTLVLMTVGLSVWAGTRKRAREFRSELLPIAWRADLRGALTDGVHPPPKYAVGTQAAPTIPTSEPPPASRAQRLYRGAEQALAALTQTIESPQTGLSVPEQHDLRSTAKELGETARQLADEVEQLEAALARAGAPEGEIAIIERRLHRLQTRKLAGETVPDDAVANLRKALAEHESDLALEADLEARLAATSAQLLEIASTASKVQRRIVLDVDSSATARDGVQRLQREVEASRAARREAAMRQAQSAGPGSR